MTEILRKDFVKNPIHHAIYMVIKAHHEVPKHTRDNLLRNKNTKDFCVLTRHFAIIPGQFLNNESQEKFYLHYDVASQLRNIDRVVVTIDCIGIYDNSQEYELARFLQLHSTKESQGLNFN